MMIGTRVGLAGALLALAALGSGAGAQNKDGKKDASEAKKENAPPPIVLRAECDRPDAIYKLDEPATFLLQSSVSGEVEYAMAEEGQKAVSEGKLRVVAGQTYKLDGKLGHPGFLRLQLTQGSATSQTTAGIEPTKIEATAKMPEDFDEFWKGQREELAKIRVDQVVEPWPAESTSTVSVYRVNLASVDNRRVYGWVAVPKGAGPFPAILTLPNAGVQGIRPDLYHADLGAVSMNITIHDFQVNYPADFYKKQLEGPLKDYHRVGWDDRDKSYFRWAILAGVRAIDYLANRKDVNAKQIAVTGVSQGGGLALCVSGLDQRVGFVAPDIAGLCDLNAAAQGRVGGWPHWMAAAPAKIKDEVEVNSQYFDAVNFARKFKGKSIHGVSFVDPVCPPSTVYAAFNQHPEPKSMIVSPRLGHTTDPRWIQAREDFWKENLTLKTPPVKK